MDKENKNYSNIEDSLNKASELYIDTALKISDKSQYLLLCYTSLNLFLWHIDTFKKDYDPTNELIKKLHAATKFLENSMQNFININSFPTDIGDKNNQEFESEISNLFSNIWLDMTDEIYFDQSYFYTCERLTKNGIDPSNLFKDKIVIDAGCGSGKFTTTIAKLGAKKVFGIDIGKKGLEFAKKQALKVSYGKNIEYINASLLDLPFLNDHVDMIWSNGVVHHTLNYDKCIKEFARVTKNGGDLFLYVNGRFGLFELLQTSIRKSMVNVPKGLFQFFLKTLNIDSGRLYWIMDCCYAPYEWRSKKQVEQLLNENEYKITKQLVRGVSIDQIEQITMGLPFANVKYGEGQLKFLCNLQRKK